MPEDNPGGLRRTQYVSIISYLLELNGMPAGEETLEDDEATLSAIAIEGPYGSH